MHNIEYTQKIQVPVYMYTKEYTQKDIFVEEVEVQ